MKHVYNKWDSHRYNGYLKQFDVDPSKKILPVFDICCQFIDRIEVSHTDKKSKTRKITIVYNFIGAFNFGRAKEKAQNTTQKLQRTA